MNLKIRDGQLTLGSVFKLVAISWACFGVIVIGGLFLLMLLIGLASGSMSVNGDMVQGRGAVLVAMIPMVILLPIVVAIQALIFGGFVTIGAALYRQRRPLSITVETTVRSEQP